MEARVARGRVRGAERVWIHPGLLPDGVLDAPSVRCAAGATMFWLGLRSVLVAKFDATTTTRQGMTITKRKANCTAHNPHYRLSAALHPPPPRHRRDIPSRFRREVQRRPLHHPPRRPPPLSSPPLTPLVFNSGRILPDTSPWTDLYSPTLASLGLNPPSITGPVQRGHFHAVATASAMPSGR